jgi:hypothetical protein
VNPDGSVTCPAVFVDNASGNGNSGVLQPACRFTIVSNGTIPPSQVTVFMKAETNGAHLDRFGIVVGGLQEGIPALPPFFTLQTGEQVVGRTFGNHLPSTYNMQLDWGLNASGSELDNDDMGKWIVVTYRIEAFA